MAPMKKTEVTRRQILKAAEKVFAESGFQESTIADIAREAGISDATVYEYFSTKEQLLFTIPHEAIIESKERLEFLLEYIRGAGNKLRSFIYHLLKVYQENPNFASVSLMLLKTSKKFMETETYTILKEYFTIFIQLINEGIESGEFKEGTDPYLIRSMLLGTIEHIVIRWLVVGKPSRVKNLIDYVDPFYDVLFSGIRKDSGTGRTRYRITVEPEDEI